MAKYTGHTITSDSALGSAVIQRSLRFNNGDDPNLQRTISTTSNRRTYTYSFWTKRGLPKAERRFIYNGHASSTPYIDCRFNYDGVDGYDTFQFFSYSSQYDMRLCTRRRFRDPNSWYHFVIAVDTTQATNTNRIKMYINGVQETDFYTASGSAAEIYPSQNFDTAANVSGNIQNVGNFRDGTSQHYDGYLAEVHFVDGYQYDSSYFGFTDPQTGIWMPKRYEGTHGTNGFHLDFSDNSSTAALGIDKSTNGNDFTVSNLAVTDSVKDTPTNAFATLNSNVYADANFKEGNLYFDTPDTHKTAYSTIAVNSGKWYWEAKAIGGSLTKWTYGVSDVKNIGVGQISGQNALLAHDTNSGSTYVLGDAVSIYIDDIRKNGSVTGSDVQDDIAQGDIVAIALDVDAGKVWFARNGTWINGSATASTTLNPASHDTTVATGETYVPAFSGESADWQANFGQDDSFSGTSTSQGNEDENGLGSFYYAVPSGFRALCTKNLPPNVPSIIRPEKHFKCITYTGDGSSDRNITGLEFKPDFVWIKNRQQLDWHMLQDSVRGANKVLYANRSEGEDTDNSNGHVNYFNEDGFNVTAGASGNVNQNTETYVAWCWKAGGAAVSNTDGDQTTQVSVNQEAGFSIVTYTGTGSNTNIGHGLGATPNIVITKSRSTTGSWAILDTVGNSTAEYSLYLNDNGGYSSYQGGTFWNDTLPNSTVFRVSSNAATNASGVTYVAYCWRSIPGFSKFGTYKGNGNDDGPFIHTGFRPAWVTVKNTSASNNWQTWDNARETSNVMQRILEFNDASTADDASSNTAIDFLSNGFKHRTSFQRSNTSGGTYIYMAFAEQPDMTPFDVFPNAR